VILTDECPSWRRGRFYFFLGIATRFILRVMQTWDQEFKSDRRMRLTDALDT